MYIKTNLLLLFFAFIIHCTPSKSIETKKIDNYSEVQNSIKIGMTVYVSSRSGLKLRQEGSLNGKILRNLSFNTKLRVLQRSNTQDQVENDKDYWYKVAIEKNTAGLSTGPEGYEIKYEILKIQGWVFGKYISGKSMIDSNNELENAFYNKEINISKYQPNTATCVIYKGPESFDVKMQFTGDTLFEDCEFKRLEILNDKVIIHGNDISRRSGKDVIYKEQCIISKVSILKNDKISKCDKIDSKPM